MSPMNKRATIYLDEELHRALKMKAAATWLPLRSGQTSPRTRSRRS